MKPSGKWALHYMGSELNLPMPRSGKWEVAKTNEGLWTVTDGTRSKLCSNLMAAPSQAALMDAMKKRSQQPPSVKVDKVVEKPDKAKETKPKTITDPFSKASAASKTLKTAAKSESKPKESKEKNEAEETKPPGVEAPKSGAEAAVAPEATPVPADSEAKEAASPKAVPSPHRGSTPRVGRKAFSVLGDTVPKKKVKKGLAPSENVEETELTVEETKADAEEMGEADPAEEVAEEEGEGAEQENPWDALENHVDGMPDVAMDGGEVEGEEEEEEVQDVDQE